MRLAAERVSVDPGRVLPESKESLEWGGVEMGGAGRGEPEQYQRHNVIEPELLSNGAQRGRPGTKAERFLRKAVLIACGQTGAALLSLAVLSTAFWVSGVSGLWVLEVMAALVLIRLGYFHTRGPKPVLGSHLVRRKAHAVIVDEVTIGIALLAACFVVGWPVGRLALLGFFGGNIILQLCLMSAFCLLIKQLANRDRLGERVDIAAKQALVVGSGKTAQRVADMVLNSPELETRLIGFLDYRRKGLWRYRDVPLVGHPDSLQHIVANTQVDALFWAVEPKDLSASWDVLGTAEKMGVRVFVMPNLYDAKVARVRSSYINDLPALVYRSDPEGHVSLVVKSLMDRIGAFIGLVLLSPVMFFCAAAIKLTSRGPVFFKQVRMGVNGHQFTLYKFRTMCCDAEKKKQELLHKNEMSGPVFKIKRDPRITAVGRYLRKYSMDELPQFLNVIRGDMSLVGPRPPLPQEVSRFEPWQHRKLSVKPGLTCLWQVNGRNDIDFDEWMRLDLQYIDNWSLWLDTKIIAKTIPAVIKGSGT